ncbi:MAG TPA: IS110 family transposase [Beijerinckiaceae bacterium]|jgi:transposase
MTKDTLNVGLDTDKNFIDIAIAEPLSAGEVRYYGKIANDKTALLRVVKRLQKDGRPLRVCYEAGPCGYAIHRWLTEVAGVSCEVVAPSLIPRRSGDRVKTNRRDCLSLAKLLRADELTAVWVPDPAHEAMRDLTRARAAAVADLTRCRQRLGSLLLRQHVRHAGQPWTKKHRAWLGRLTFEAPAHRLLIDELLEALDQAQARRDRLSAHIAELAPRWSLAWLVDALQVLRGYQLINATTIVAEIGDVRRFANPRQLMDYVGLTVSEHSTGERVRRGGITKAGNGRARKALVEAAWTYTHPAKGAKAKAAQATPALRAIAEKARHRLSARYRKLRARGKLAPVAVTAIARESLGFIWAIAQAAAPAPTPQRRR